MNYSNYQIIYHQSLLNTDYMKYMKYSNLYYSWNPYYRMYSFFFKKKNEEKNEVEMFKASER